ncbi:hypothetical protein BRADI_4g17555v3, partial [Brachypodium distachyon]
TPDPHVPLHHPSILFYARLPFFFRLSRPHAARPPARPDAARPPAAAALSPPRPPADAASVCSPYLPRLLPYCAAYPISRGHRPAPPRRPAPPASPPTPSRVRCSCRVTQRDRDRCSHRRLLPPRASSRPDISSRPAPRAAAAAQSYLLFRFFIGRPTFCVESVKFPCALPRRRAAACAGPRHAAPGLLHAHLPPPGPSTEPLTDIVLVRACSLFFVSVYVGLHG